MVVELILPRLQALGRGIHLFGHRAQQALALVQAGVASLTDSDTTTSTLMMETTTTATITITTSITPNKTNDNNAHTSFCYDYCNTYNYIDKHYCI